MRARVLVVFLLAGPGAALGFDANGVELGSAEAAVKAAFPEAHCKPLEWKSDAADRRCDDSKIEFAGVPARVTFYLRDGSVQAFDLRLQTSEFESVAAKLKARYGKPAFEGRETVRHRSRPAQEVYRLRWQAGKDRATYSARAGDRRAQLFAWRGNFDSEIYRVK
jgi:hypothetical protein